MEVPIVETQIPQLVFTVLYHFSGLLLCQLDNCLLAEGIEESQEGLRNRIHQPVLFEVLLEDYLLLLGLRKGKIFKAVLSLID